MIRKRYTEEQIIAVLNEAEAGARTADLCRKYGMSDATVGCQRFWTVLGPRDWGEEAPGLRVSLTS